MNHAVKKNRTCSSCNVGNIFPRCEILFYESITFWCWKCKCDKHKAGVHVIQQTQCRCRYMENTWVCNCTVNYAATLWYTTKGNHKRFKIINKHCPSNTPVDWSKLSCDRYAWNWVAGMKLAGSEFEPSLFSSAADEFSLYLDVGTGDLEGLGDLGVKRDWDLPAWPWGDAWEFSASEEWCVAFAVLVADSWSFNKQEKYKWIKISPCVAAKPVQLGQTSATFCWQTHKVSIQRIIWTLKSNGKVVAPSWHN